MAAWRALAVLPLIVAAGPPLAAAETPDAPETPEAPEASFQALLETGDDAYMHLRDQVLASPDAGAVIAVGAGRKAPDAWRSRLQSAVLRGWLDDPDGLRAVRREIAGWTELPVVTTVTGDRILRAPFEPFEGSERALELVLVEILLHHRGSEQFRRPEQLEAVFHFLGTLRSALATPLLLAIATDDDEILPVRRYALEALAATGDPEAVEPLIELASADPDARIRRLAVAALKETGSTEALPVLERLAAEDDDRRVRNEARSAIEYIGIYNELLDQGPAKPTEPQA